MKIPTWQIPLGQPPEVVAIGRHAHGFVPRDRYRLDDLWSLHLYGYDATLRLDGQEVAVRPGVLGITPPGTLMETRYFGVSVHVFAHFRLSPGPTRAVAALTDLGSAYRAFYDELYDASCRFTQEPTWTAARVWNAIWTALSLDSPAPSGDAAHPAVRRATDLIERRLGQPLSVADLAHEAGIAPSYLTRLFREAYGETVVGHIRRRRMERASHLLLRSTLPIKVVAATVGYPDLQMFNKAARAHFGMGPREWRTRGTEPQGGLFAVGAPLDRRAA